MDEGAGGHGAERDGSHGKGARSSGLLEGRKRREACGRRIGRRRLQAGVVDAEPRRRWQCVWGKALWGMVLSRRQGHAEAREAIRKVARKPKN